MSDNPNETDFDQIIKELEDLIKSPVDASKPAKPKKGFQRVITGDLWQEPGEELKRTGDGELYATLSVDRAGDYSYGITLGVFTCEACGELHVNLFFDAKLAMEFKVTPSGQVSMKPHFKWVKKPKKD